MDQQAAIAEMLRLMQEDPERYPEQSDQPISDEDIRSNVGGITPTESEENILDRADREHGIAEAIKPYSMGGSSKITQPNDLYESYKYGKEGEERFLHGGERIPLSMFPREQHPPGYVRRPSYLDPYRGDIIQPRISPGIGIREGQYNQGRDAVMDFLKQQLEHLGY